MIQASVDLPEPLSPWINTPSPSCTAKSMSRNAVCAHGVPRAYSWLTPLSSRTGAPRGTSSPAVAGCTSACSTIGTSAVLSAIPRPVRLTVRSAASASLL